MGKSTKKLQEETTRILRGSINAIYTIVGLSFGLIALGIILLSLVGVFNAPQLVLGISLPIILILGVSLALYFTRRERES